MQFLDSTRNRVVIGLALGLLVLTWWSLQPVPGSPESICERAVRDLVAAAEAKKVKPFRTWLSDEVRDDSKRTKAQIITTLRGIFLRYRNVSLHIVSLDVTQGTNPDLVDARLVLLMSDSALPQDRGTFLLTFRREGDRWRIWQLTWEDGAVYGL